MPADTVTRRAPARGNPLAAARERAGLTQAQLAEKLSVNRVSIARLEAGTRSPSMALALRLAKVLNESVDALFGGGR
jgi:putative transcriptional regulator